MSETTRKMKQVVVLSGPVQLAGVLSIPEGARNVVSIAYERVGDTEDYLRSLNDLADAYNQAGLATLSVNLLSSEDEELDKATGFFRENTDVLHQRVIDIMNWLSDNDETNFLGFGHFGVGVSGAAILEAASFRPDAVHAIVAVSPLIDLGSSCLPNVIAPTLIVAGDRDRAALDMDQAALGQLTTDTTLDDVREARERGLPHRLEAIPGVTSVFENEQSLQRLEQLAAPWFTRFLSAG